MNSKGNNQATKDEATPALVPKLRFPEFRGAWEKKTLETLGYFTGGGTPSKDNAAYWTGEIPWISSSDLNEDSVTQINIRRFITKQAVQDSATKIVPTKSILLISRVGVGKLAVSTFPLCTSQDFTNFTPTAADSLFLAYLLKSQKDTLLSFNQGTSIKGFTKDNIASLHLGVPSPTEQKKIADCLSSVDDLIAAQAQKLNALKTHKKGLMQQLFPREDEAQPRLRFPEFQNAGKWEVRTIGEMFSLINGCAFKPEDWKPIGTPIIRIQNLNDPSADFNYSQAPVPERNRVDSGDLLFAWSGTLGSSFGARIWNGPAGVLNQHIFKVLMDEQQIILQFALLVLVRVEEDIARRTHGFKASFVHVKKSDLIKVELLLPSVPEQQRIASCLSSLDALITAETQKLETLKNHKKGLMQQLFPSPEAVQA
jgi:type I restriction enzyme S subunit